jgi:hypothetical protein
MPASSAPAELSLCSTAGPAGAAADPAQYSLAKLRLPEAHALATGERVWSRSSIPRSTPRTRICRAWSQRRSTRPAAGQAASHGTGIAGVIAAHGKLTVRAPGVRILAAHAFQSRLERRHQPRYPQGLDWAGKSKRTSST